MNEVEKMYSNAGIELNEGLEWVCKNPDHCTYQNLSITPENCSGCEHFEREMIYPPFTAEKQLELIKLLIKDYNYYLDVIDANNFENSLAASLNDLWQDLTEAEKAEIKNILEM